MTFERKSVEVRVCIDAPAAVPARPACTVRRARAPQSRPSKNEPPACMTTLKREPGTTLHRQLFLVLRDQIHGGRFAQGDLIPTEDALEALYGVSRITVRRAVADLEAEGLVRKQPGRGTFVTGAAPAARP